MRPTTRGDVSAQRSARRGASSPEDAAARVRSGQSRNVRPALESRGLITNAGLFHAHEEEAPQQTGPTR